MDQQLDVTVHA